MLTDHHIISWNGSFSKFKSIILNNGQTLNINCPIRLHDLSLCKCDRFKFVLNKLNVNPTHRVVYIIEKIWNDDEYSMCPKNIFIIHKKNDLVSESDNNFLLESIFEKSSADRKYILNYFDEYVWSDKNSKMTRDILSSMMSICLCRYNLILNETTCNSGFVILGDKKNMSCISHCFNKYIKKTEFSKLIVTPISSLSKIPNKNKDYVLKEFLEDSNSKKINDSLYTVIGEKTCHDTNNNLIYSFSFGKREWFLKTSETSFNCAKRELYEEFNIQMSQKILDYSHSNNKLHYIHKPGFMLYFICLPPKITISYYKESDTIYLNC